MSEKVKGWAFDFDDRRFVNVFRVEEGPYGYSPITHMTVEAALRSAICTLKREREMIDNAIQAAEEDLAALSKDSDHAMGEGE